MIWWHWLLIGIGIGTLIGAALMRVRPWSRTCFGATYHVEDPEVPRCSGRKRQCTRCEAWSCAVHWDYPCCDPYAEMTR